MRRGAIIAILIAVAVALVIINFLQYGFNGKEEQKQTISEQFDNIDVETENVKIEILPASGSTAEVELAGNKKGKYKLTTNVEGDTLHVEVENKRFQMFSIDFFNPSPTSLKVYLPEKAYDTVEVVTDNGQIIAGGMEADLVNMEADNGKILLDKIKSSLINVEVDNGEVSLENIEGEIHGTSNNGRISLKTESLDRPLTLETDNGTIDIQTVEPPTNATFDITLDNGKVNVFGESNYDSVIGNGDNVIKLTADNGKITVR
ncbi:DUF4097 family beta strand repeat-containing protein [Oceanobacillus damuensis]|uniref:DUF4097 family beta strand repeat-containing protein n=1 Tax=Oceanobacillus damuensis TaxID=937928 RepID=UPI001F2A31EC|nr:DUF4097 family beta strand repeat-containing protein [Oceanobacillus damuensis]